MLCLYQDEGVAAAALDGPQVLQTRAALQLKQKNGPSALRSHAETVMKCGYENSRYQR